MLKILSQRRQARAAAPRPPSRAEVQYLLWVKGFVRSYSDLVQRKLAPLVEKVRAEAPAPVEHTTPEGVRTDAIDELDAVFAELALELGRLTSDEALAPGLISIAAAVSRHNAAELARVLSLDLHGDNTLAPFVRQFVRKNVSLIRGLGFDQLELMQTTVKASIANQVNVRDLASVIKERLDVTQSRANLIARDQTLKANADLGQLRMQGLGITEYIWVTSKDERVRGKPGGEWPTPKGGGGNHYQLEGQRFSWDKPPVVDTRTGRRAHPGADFQCRCTASPILPEEGIQVDTTRKR
jgi:hypothetical protein